MKIWAVALLVTLAGCLSGGPPDDSDEAPTSSPTPTNPPPQTPATPRSIPMLLDFEYSGCQGYVSYWPIPLDRLQAALPEGFTASEEDFGAAGSGLAQYRWMQCDAFKTQSAAVNDTVYGHVGIAIEPVPGIEQAEGRVPWYLLRMLVQDDILNVLWEAANYDRHVGDWQQGPPLGLAQYGVGSYGVQGVAGVPAQLAPLETAYMTQAENGLLVWTASEVFTTATQLTGMMATPTDDPIGVEIADTTNAFQWTVDGAEFTGIDLWLYT